MFIQHVKVLIVSSSSLLKAVKRLVCDIIMLILPDFGIVQQTFRILRLSTVIQMSALLDADERSKKNYHSPVYCRSRTN